MERLPVQTFVMEHDWGVLADAMRRELDRGRPTQRSTVICTTAWDNIERTAMKISELMDGAVVAVAHGKMDAEQLGRIMEDMAEGSIQILVCTTIIETGIDIPNVNTLIIEDADKLGPRAAAPDSRTRWAQRAQGERVPDLPAGQGAQRDSRKAARGHTRVRGVQLRLPHCNARLEIRGAGSLLGAEQSGHLTDVGYDMYLRLLEEAVLEERGEKSEQRANTTADFAVSANIPESYVTSSEQRMDLYRRIALIRTEADADDVLDELIDRFGEPPGSVTSLVRCGSCARPGRARPASPTSRRRAIYCASPSQNFDMERVSELYSRSKYKGRLKVEASKKPVLALKLAPKSRVLDEAGGLHR